MNDSNKDKFDVFLSYRRNGGAETAQLLYDRLTRKGYKVSFDLETLRSGQFDKQLYTRIEQCKDVVVIMSKGALQIRENLDSDWLRLEVKYALEHQKNIVPVFLRDFDRTDVKKLPQEDVLTNVCGYEGVTASHEHFDSTFTKLCRLLTAKPVHPWKRFGIIGVAILLLIAGIVGFAYRDHIQIAVFAGNGNMNDDSRHDKKQFGELLNDSGVTLDNVEDILTKAKEANNSLFAKAKKAYDQDDYETSFPIFKKLSDSGYTKAYVYLGMAYEFNEGGST